LNDFVRADVGTSDYAALALRELAEDIFSLFLTPEASKYIGDVPEDITRELCTTFALQSGNNALISFSQLSNLGGKIR
jgi:hypothetical protein